ncbi:MAG: radical SAM protein [Candidatus Nanoarchaeia archaeon]|nr:radical SAM protein [Candidatus Nanoarchaeia archaeon]
MTFKTPYSSFCLNGFPQGCKHCVKGEKLVLFISGKCNRNCWYCSLSNKRKNKDVIWANERKIKNSKELIEEAIESNATSAGITGGDPLLFMERTIEYTKALKQKFGKRFHIHIYLPTQNLTENRLKQLSKYIDEVRFHPEFLIDKNSVDNDIEKIKIALNFWKKENIGIELPMIPDKKQEILDFIIKISPLIGFVNLNEFELSETNSELITRNYLLNEGGYTIKGSREAGLWILEELKKLGTGLKIHICTAELKNNHQFKNRLLKHKILPYGKRTKDGTVLYLITKYNKENQLKDLIKNLDKNQFYIDKKKQRILLSNSLANKLLAKKYKIILVEEFPTYDRLETETKNL